MTWWAKVSVVLLVFAAVVCAIAGTVERDLSELALAACVGFLAATTWKNGPRRRTPHA